MATRTAAAILLTALFAGCCTQVKPPGGVDITKLPPPISLQEQVTRLDAKVAALPRLRATSVVRGVELRYVENGQAKTQNFEGTLLLRQPRDTSQSVDVFLMGRAFEQEVMQAGRNAERWWCIVRLDIKRAWTGDARVPMRWDAGGGGGRGPVAILRVDPVPELLGMTAIGGRRAAGGGGEAVVMRVDDYRGVNELIIEEVGAAGVVIKREIDVDRVTGDVREVRLRDAAGVLVVRSVLSDFRAVQYTGEGNTAAVGEAPRVPYHVELEYPAQRTSVSLQFERVVVPATMSDAAFETPDFEGLQVTPG